MGLPQRILLLLALLARASANSGDIQGPMHGGQHHSGHTHLALDQAKIPYLLHQSWKSEHLPSPTESWRQSMLDQNAGWQLVHWTDDDNAALVQTHAPWLQDIYDKLHGVYRADMVRPLYMWLYGGIYADLDFVSLRPFAQLFEALPKNTNVVLGRDCGRVVDRSNASQSCEDYDKGIPNAFMASKRGHPFWHYVLHNIVKQVWSAGPDGNLRGPEEVTGPKPLYLAVQKYTEHMLAINQSNDIHVLGEEVFPLSWTEHETIDNLGCCYSLSNKSFDADCCRVAFPKAYVMTFWTKLWG